MPPALLTCHSIGHACDPMVTHLIDIGQRGWLQLSDYGSVQVVPAAVREAEGIAFEDSYERTLYERYGAIPKSLRPEGRTS